MKKIIAILTATILILGTFLISSAESIQVSAIERSDYKLYINGEQKVNPEGLNPLIYKNRTYLPLSYIANLLSLDIKFDVNSKMISLSTDKSKNTLLEAQAEHAKVVKAYEDKIAELEAKIKKMEEADKSLVKQSEYTKLPLSVSKNGYTFQIQGLSVNDNGEGKLYVSLRNNDNSQDVKIDAFKTTLNINNQEYKPQILFAESFDKRLADWIKRGESLDAYITFAKLPKESEIKNFDITMYLEENSFNPVSQMFTFKAIND